jgi:hypothetical protein
MMHTWAMRMSLIAALVVTCALPLAAETVNIRNGAQHKGRATAQNVAVNATSNLTMVGVLEEGSNGDDGAAGSLTLRSNDTQERYSFAFRGEDFRIEGVHWSNMMILTTPNHPGYWISLACPRHVPCTIILGRTKVRIEYITRSGIRYAQNLFGLDPLVPIARTSR